MESDKEQRESPRAPLKVQAECQAGEASSVGHTQDISEGGLLVLTPDTLLPGTKMTIRFNLPPEHPRLFVEAPGYVARAQAKEYMGIQFHRLTDQQREAIAKYVRQVLAGNF